MIRDTVVDVLIERLNNRTDLENAIILEMQIAQEMRLEQSGRFFPWFLVTEFATEYTVANENRVPVPTDFLAEIEEEGLWIAQEDGSWGEVKKGAASAWQLKWGTATGRPENFALVGEEFILYPTPDVAYQMRMKYYAKEASLATNIENNWLKYAADLMIAEVGEVIASQKMQNPTLAALFQKEKDPAWDRLYRMHEARAHSNRSYTMGEEE